MHFVQAHLEHSRDDLHDSREAPRRRENQGEALRRDLAIAHDLVDDLGRRMLIDFEHQAGRIGGIAIAELLEEVFLHRETPARTGAERTKALLALPVRETPPGILTAQAGKYRIARMHEHL
jgi:hypothetical protein